MEYIDIYPDERINFNYENPLQEELGRLSEYQGVIPIPRKYYVVAPGSHLVAKNYHVGISSFKRVILESLPRAESIGLIAEAKLAIRTVAPQSHTVHDPAVSLVHRQASNYGHWLMDYLPRALAGLHYRQRVGANVKVIVPYPLAPWQARSLQLIDLNERDLISVSTNHTGILNIKMNMGIFTRSHSFYSDPRYGCRDALSPFVFSSMANLMKKRMLLTSHSKEKTKLVILRKTSGGRDRRFIQNQPDLEALLNPYGFLFTYLEDLSLDEQISLFENASHIIAIHGSGLANLIFSEGAHTLEIFSSGHGIRPEYLQLSRMNYGKYAHIVVKTSPPFHDIHIPLIKVKKFLEISL